MKPETLPRDLAAYARRACLWRIAPFCLLETLMITVLVCLGDALFGKELSLLYRILIYGILAAIPFFVTKFPWRLRERTFRGTVVAVSTDHTFHIGYSGSRPASRGGMVMFNTSRFRSHSLCLTIRRADGRLLRQKLPAPLPPNPPPAVGDEVFHLFGSDHVLILPIPSDDHRHCAVCNDINALDSTVCRTCGHSMVK